MQETKSTNIDIFRNRRKYFHYILYNNEKIFGLVELNFLECPLRLDYKDYRNVHFRNGFDIYHVHNDKKMANALVGRHAHEFYRPNVYPILVDSSAASNTSFLSVTFYSIMQIQFNVIIFSRLKYSGVCISSSQNEIVFIKACGLL